MTLLRFPELSPDDRFPDDRFPNDLPSAQNASAQGSFAHKTRQKRESEHPLVDPRTWLPTAEEIVAACDAASEAGEPKGLVQLLGDAQTPQLGAPPLDCSTTVMSARAALLAAEQGRAFYHHELRERVPMPPGQGPEIAVWDAGTTPVWNQGILEEPKYFSFFQDAPFAAFNPNHRRKWRPHELLHGAMRFFWHPQMTRFEMYLASRVNELLPVVHWYGFDEIFRPRCPAHLGKQIFAQYCPDCEALAAPYWTQTPEWRNDLRDQAIGWAEQGLTHFEREWHACQAELRSGHVHAEPWEQLDASSDAIAYMRSHWNRVTAWSFGAWVETFLTDDVDYFSSLGRYMTHLARTTRRLLGGPVGVAPEDFQRRRGRRAIQDLAYRIYVALDWVDGDSREVDQVEDALTPALDEAAHHVHRLLDDPQLAEANDQVLDELLAAFAAVSGHFPDEVARSVGALGYTWHAPARFIRAGKPQLLVGLADALPSTADYLEDALPDLVEKFAGSAEFRAHGRLAERFARWMGEDGGLFDGASEVSGSDEGGSEDGLSENVSINSPGHLAAQLAFFEAWATRAPREDRTAELFAAMPHHFDEFAIRPGRARLNKTLLRRVFSAQLAVAITGDDALLELGDEIDLARIFMHGELRVLPVEPDVAQIFDALDAGRPRADWIEEIDPEVLASLLENGFIIWLPEPF